MVPANAALPPVPAPEGGSGFTLLLVLGVFFVLLLFGLLRTKLRPRGAPPPKSPAQVKAELEAALEEGIRDVPGEAHLRAFVRWSRFWAFLEFLGFAFFLLPLEGEEGHPAAALALAGLSGILWTAMWAAGKAAQGGSDGGRLLYASLATLLGLFLAFTLAFDPRPWATDARGRFVHGFMVLYTMAGATFLFSPRCARLFSAEYRDAATKGTPLGKEAEAVASFRSPFSWLPVVCLLGSLLVQALVEEARKAGV